MAQTLYIRAPFAKVAGALAGHYTVTEDYDANRRTVIQVDGTDAARLRLEPIFPGKLTFKPAAGAAIPADPSADATTAISGDLYLEVSPVALAEMRADVPSLGYALLFAYLGVTLKQEFFTGTVLEALKTPSGAYKTVVVAGVNLTTAAQLSSNFANAKFGVDLAPKIKKNSTGCTFPALVADGAGLGSVSLACGVRTVTGPPVAPPTIASLIAAGTDVLAQPGLALLPLPFFYRFLRHAVRWTTLAATNHDTHPFYEALDAREAAGARWRRLRLFPLGARTETVRPHAAYDDITARGANPVGGAQLWQATPTRVGEVFLNRADGEGFRLTAQGPAGTLPLAVNIGDARTASVDLQWAAPPVAGQEPAAHDITVELPVDPATIYGGYDLRLGDQDATLRFGGAVRSAAAGDAVPAEGELGYVRQLQDDLIRLGFRILGAANGEFRPATEWAVREFQIYAKMDFVAAETASAPNYVDRLSRVANDNRYAGWVSGVANAETRRIIQYWLANNWRCPVVVDVRNDAETVVIAENIWRHNEVQQSQDRRMLVRDFSGYYTFPATRDPSALIRLGYYDMAGGPNVIPQSHSWQPEAEILPQHLVGTALAALAPDELSTFRVVRAVAEQECVGHFDCVNSWDAGSRQRRQTGRGGSERYRAASDRGAHAAVRPSA